MNAKKVLENLCLPELQDRDTMKKILFPALAAMMLAVSCGPSKHAVHVEMRHPSKAGVDIAVIEVAPRNQEQIVALAEELRELTRRTL